MAGNRRISKLNDRAYDVLKKSQSDYLKTNGFFSTDIFSISSDAPNQVRAAIEIANRVTFAIFLQAVIDDDVETVKKCLDAEPDLISGQPDKNLVIESKLTWQKFYAETALTMAVKRKQIKMIELLLPYYDKLPQTEDIIKAKTEALSAWVFYETQKNAEGVDEIIIPQEYAAYAQSLIDVFQEETFPNGDPGVNGIPLNVALSEKTECALESLFNILLPKKAVKLDDYIDPELFLLALYKTYDDDHDNNDEGFENWEQRDAFCIRMIGLAQSVLPPETTNIFCSGLYFFEENTKISAHTNSLKLRNGKAFYRPSRDVRSGLGFEYVCDNGGYAGNRDAAFEIAFSRRDLEKICRAKTTSFRKYYATIAATAKPPSLRK